MTVLQASGRALFRTALNAVVSTPFEVTAIPYYANANRGTCPMQVWMAEGQEGCRPARQE